MLAITLHHHSSAIALSRWRTLFAILSLLLQFGCAAPARYVRISEPNQDLDLHLHPSGQPVLSIQGDVGVTNSGDELILDMDMLEQMGLIKYRVTDPWLKRDVCYSGVLLSDMVTRVRGSENASVIHLIALDDYEAEIGLDILEQWPVMLATRSEDTLISVESGGPTRIILPYDDYPDLAEARAMSIWTISRIIIQ